MTEYSEFDRLLSRYFDGSTRTPTNWQRSKPGCRQTSSLPSTFRGGACCIGRSSELLTESKLHDLMDQFVHRIAGVAEGCASRQSASTTARNVAARSDWRSSAPIIAACRSGPHSQRRLSS